MNAIQVFIRTTATQPWVECLGMTLLHFLWQGLIIVIIYASARRWAARTAGPNGRYLLACAALAAMGIAPAMTWMLLRGPVPESVAVTFAAPMSAARLGPVSIHLSTASERSGSRSVRAIPVGAIPVLGSCDLVCRRGRFLGAPADWLDTRRASSLQNGAPSVGRMAEYPQSTQEPRLGLPAGPPTRIGSAARSGGHRMAATGCAGARGRPSPVCYPHR